MKARINEHDQIEVFGTVPNVWKNHLNFQMADTSLLHSEGFYDVEEPLFNQTTQKVGDIYFDEDNDVFKYAIINKTQAEIDFEAAIAGWHDTNSAMRFKISLLAINVNQQLQGFVSQLILWWNLMKFVHEVDEEFAYFYCNQILPPHQAIVDSFLGLIEIEDIPEWSEQ